MLDLDALDGLGRLVDRSLVVADHQVPTRYRMLETIRQYARDQLVISEEVAELGAAHLAFFRALALEAGPALHGRDMIAWLDRLDAESDNLRSALDWAFESDPEAALDLCLSLADYWSTRSNGSEGLDWLRRAVEIARAIGHDTTSPSWRDDSIRAARTLAAAAVTHSLWAEPGRRSTGPRKLSRSLDNRATRSPRALPCRPLPLRRSSPDGIGRRAS